MSNESRSDMQEPVLAVFLFIQFVLFLVMALVVGFDLWLLGQWWTGKLH